MTEDVMKEIFQRLNSLGACMSLADVSAWALANDVDEHCLQSTAKLLEEAGRLDAERRALGLRAKSRIPQTSPKTFDNFSTDRLSNEDRRKLLALRTLSFIPAGRGLMVVGGDWTGKTHLVQAIGNECCDHGYRTLYLTGADLKARMDKADSKGTTERLIHTLSNYACLIVDSIDKERFSARQTYIFYRLVDRRVSSCTSGSMVIASSLDLDLLAGNFEDTNKYVALMDRITCSFTCYVLQSKGYLGKTKEIVPLKLIG